MILALLCRPARLFRGVLAGSVLAILLGVGCVGPQTPHPAVGKRVGSLPLVAIVDPGRPAPTLTGHVTLLNFWGTWCPPCRRELPGLGRIASRLADDDRFQLVAVSCGPGGPDNIDDISADTKRFLDRERIAIEPWCDPRGMVRMLFSEAYGFEAFPTTYLVGADGRIRRVWAGYRNRDEAEIAAALVEALKEAPQDVPRE
jgi:thiol-disulfide isomerase/thioredoxin